MVKLNIICLTILFSIYSICGFAQIKTDISPADDLPPYIERLTLFGERAEWSHDGKRILFIGKTYGDVFEIEVKTGQIKLVTGHFYHGGFVRALYLANGDVLLAGSTAFDSENPHINREINAEMWILDKSYTKPPTRMGTKVYDGPAVSRENMKIVYSHIHVQYPQLLAEDQAIMWMADIAYDNEDIPYLDNKKRIFDNLNRDKRWHPKIEPSNFIPPDEKEVTITGYHGGLPTEVMKLNIESGEVTTLSKLPELYNEPEGIFPNGEYTLVESNGWGYDLYKMKLDGSGERKRLTYFGDYETYRATNGRVSDDGKFMAFQKARHGDRSGVGYGLFLYDFEKAKEYYNSKE